MNRRLRLIICLLLLVSLKVAAQETTTSLTVYRDFQPATIYLMDGRKMKVPLANIFLKNSGFLYKSGDQTKEANIKTLKRVEFKDRTYYRIDTMLAYRVDTVGEDGLFCAWRIDIESYRQMRANNRDITSLSFGDMVSYSAADLAAEEDLHFPIVPVYYYLYHGQYVLTHERRVGRLLNKEQKRMMATLMNDRSFSWTDEESLMKLLRLIH